VKYDSRRGCLARRSLALSQALLQRGSSELLKLSYGNPGANRSERRRQMLLHLC
jgi:hypothetical protein